MLRFGRSAGRFWFLAAALLALAPLHSAPSQAASLGTFKLVALPPYADVGSYRISPDGLRVVYIADQETDGVNELYTVPMQGGASSKLNPTLTAGGDVQAFDISPDGRRVVYMADQDTDGVLEFYSVPIQGPPSEAVKISGPMSPGGNKYYWFLVKFSPDSQRVVYKVDQETPGLWELYSVPISGPASAGTKLNGPLRGGSAYCDFDISPDGSRVVYTAPQGADFVYELFSVPIAGPASAAIKLSGVLPEGSSVSSNTGEVLISPDSSRVVYRADQDRHKRWELYSVPIAGPASAGVKLNHDMGGDAGPVGDDVHYFRLTPDGQQVAFVATWVNSFDAPPYTYSVNVWELFSVPIEGPASAEVKVYGPSTGLNAGYPYRNVAVAPNSNPVNDLSIAPDGTRLVYRAEYVYTDRSQLYSIPRGGPAGANQRLDSTTPGEDGGEVTQYQISPDGSRVVYRADQDATGVSELYSVAIAGPAGSDVKLNGTLTSGGAVLSDFRISPDGSRVVYRADQESDEVGELYSVPLSGPASAGVKLNGPVVSHGYVTSFAFSPNGRWVVYRADQDTNDVFELYATDIGAPVGPTPTRTPTHGPTTIPTATPTATLPPEVSMVYLPLVLKQVPVRTPTPTPTRTSEPTRTPTPTATLEPGGCPRAGEWWGNTDQGREVRFRVEHSPQCQIADGSLRIAYNPSPGTCPGQTYTYGSAFPIVDGRFDAQDASNKVRVQGQFSSSSLSAGTVDVSFQYEGWRCTYSGDWAAAFVQGANRSVRALAVQPDGKILLAGEFTAVAGQARRRVARLNSDGSLDATFNDPDADGTVYALAIQPDNKILIGGSFGIVDGQTRKRVARLNSDGSLDPTFGDPNGSGAINALAVQADGKIVVGGSFFSFGGQERWGIARLHPNGALDTAFVVTYLASGGQGTNALVLQPDGDILVGGRFENMGELWADKLIRLHPDGTLDFFRPGWKENVYSLALQADGKIVTVGSWEFASRMGIRRFLPIGGHDIHFQPPTVEANVLTVALQTDGRIVVGGYFQQLDGQPHKYIGRLSPGGALDAAFNPAPGSTVFALAVQPDNKILVGGEFTTMSGQWRHGIARLNADGTLDATFLATGAN